MKCIVAQSVTLQAVEEVVEALFLMQCQCSSQTFTGDIAFDT